MLTTTGSFAPAAAAAAAAAAERWRGDSSVTGGR